jgi:maltose-binding protein MalE
MLKAHRNHPAFASTKPPSTPSVPLDEAPFAVPPPMGPTYMDVNRVMTAAMATVYSGEQTARQAIEANLPELNSIMEQAKTKYKV